MSERIGRERLLEMLLAGTPDRLLTAMAAASPEDAEDLIRLRGDLALLALVPPPVRPPPRLRERVLRSRPRGPKRPVLVVIDMLNDHLTPGRPIEIPRARAIVPALQARLADARARATPVVYVCDHHAPDDEDFREWPAHNIEGTPGADVWPDLAPQPGDHVVRKRTYSAFAGTDFGPLLDRLDADELVLTGCATEVQLAATAMEALQRGFVVTIPPECQAGVSQVAELVTMATLGAMPPFEPRYLRR
jgi:nicotinamidase-related amidase